MSVSVFLVLVYCLANFVDQFGIHAVENVLYTECFHTDIYLLWITGVEYLLFIHVHEKD